MKSSLDKNDRPQKMLIWSKSISNFRFADIKYTQGGFEHMELAKTYYSQSAKLNPDNMRALYGLLLVSVLQHKLD